MNVLVTGGGGFLGQALCRNLVERGFEVVSFNRGRYPALDALGDLADRDAMVRAAEGVGAIFHNAAKAGAWGPYDDYFRANVLGTRNVLDACRTHGIARLVYTSTPSVTHRATHPVAPASRLRMRRPRRSPNRKCSRPTARRSPPSRCARA